MAQQMYIKKSNLFPSENNVSHIRKTSGKGNSCDNNNVSHLKLFFKIEYFTQLITSPETIIFRSQF